MKREQHQYIINYFRSMPSKKEARNGNFFSTIAKLRNPKREEFLRSIEENPVELRLSEIPTDVTPSAIAVACYDLGLLDREVFDLKDKETRGFLNETKVLNNWSVYKNLCESASYEMLY